LPGIQLCLFASTPDITGLGFIVKVLTGSLEELAARAVSWGYDGIEFMPDPEQVPEPALIEHATRNSGAVVPVLNTGRMTVQGLALLDADPVVRRRSIDAFKRILDLAGALGARVGLGGARGKGIPGATREEMDSIAGDVFGELAQHAEKARAVIMLEPADPGVTAFINTMDEAMAWVRRIASPAFSVMLDTYELAESEPSIEHGIRAAQGTARHIHLYDPSRWPPGVLAHGDRLDWLDILRVLREERFEGSASVVVAPEGDPEPAARKSAAFLRSLFQLPGVAS
jgi:D-psicose/D-tagatose/L-ribulose 3-epimerase